MGHERRSVTICKPSLPSSGDPGGDRQNWQHYRARKGAASEAEVVTAYLSCSMSPSDISDKFCFGRETFIGTVTHKAIIKGPEDVSLIL